MAVANQVKEVIFLTIAIELEKSVDEIGGEVCRRIVMHPDVKDANVLKFKKLTPAEFAELYPMGI